MSNTRHKDIVWNCGDPVASIHHAQIAVLMDIRDELKRLNSLLHCVNFTSLPFHIQKSDRSLSGLRQDLKKKGGATRA